VYRRGHLERVLLEAREVGLRGAFNLENVLGAAAAACVLGADFDAVRSAVREFKGVEHRLEYVRDIRGVEFYNNSKATSVDATAKSLEAFERGVHLIMGGKDKGAPYAPLRPLMKDRVREVLLIGAAADRIAQELSGAVELVRAGNLESAVPEAFQRARPGDVVLLAPACSSFDQFLDYEQRGRVFKELVERLAQDVESGSVKWKWNSRRQAASQSSPEVEEALKHIAGPAIEDSSRQVTNGSPEEAATREPILVYEISAGEFPPAEVELAEDYSEPPETSQAQVSAKPERIDGAPLPYERKAEGRQLRLPRMD